MGHSSSKSASTRSNSSDRRGGFGGPMMHNAGNVFSGAPAPAPAPAPVPAPEQHTLNERVAVRGRNLFCTLLDNRDQQAERKQADDRRSVAKLGAGYRIPRAFVERFDWGELVGSGAYSYVQKAVDRRTGQPVAIKCIRKDPLDQELCDQIETEVELQSEVCEHENIVKIIEFVNTPSMYFIVMELLVGDLLRNIVMETRAGNYSERMAASTVRGLASALSACHARDIAHLDIKPDNVLFDSAGVLKLADFGMAAKVPVYRDVGTPLFVAPEILLEGKCDTKADIFSLGVVAYILLCGFAPWVEARTLDDLSSAIKKGKWDFYSPFWDGISKEAKSLVRRMMDMDPRKRPTAREVMADVWVSGTASSRPINNAVPRRIISHARHEFVKRASQVQMLVRLKRGQLKRRGSREALNMARTAPLRRPSLDEAAEAAGAAPEQAAAVANAGEDVPIASSGTQTAMPRSSLRGSRRKGNASQRGGGAEALPGASSTPRVVVSRHSKVPKQSSLRVAAKAAAKRRRERKSGGVSFADVVVAATASDSSRGSSRAGSSVSAPATMDGGLYAAAAAPSSGAGGAGAGGSGVRFAVAGGGAVGGMTEGDREARRALRESERRRRSSASRWERLKEASALVAARVRELDAMHVAELEEIF